MSESRDEILADFQSITAIDDVAEAIHHLEECNWNLESAIQRVLPQDVDGLPEPVLSFSGQRGFAPRISHSAAGSSGAAGMFNNDLDHFDVGPAGVEELMTAPSSPVKSHSNPDTSKKHTGGVWFNSGDAGASTSRSSSSNDFRTTLNFLDTKPYDLLFNVHFKEALHQINISNHATIGDLKAKIFSKTNVPVCRQALKGWEPGKQKDTANLSTPLKALSIDGSKEFNLVLNDLTEEGFVGEASMDVLPNLNQLTYTLHIHIEPENKLLKLNFPAQQDILSIKNSVYTVTDIPVRHQVWSGWPSNVNDNLTIIPIDSESSGEEFEDASDFNNDDDIFTETPIINQQKRLIPDNTDDEAIGSVMFVTNFVERYGPQHPKFFLGNLEEALKDACHRPSARDRKLLAIYLHHDGSVLTNVFCGQLLACESIIQILSENFVLYGWDLTFESNKNMFLSSISACVGMTASITVRNIATDRLPAILVISKNRSQCEVFQVIYGNVGVDDLLSKLMEASDMYTEQLMIELREENERFAREQVKLEQDAAYRESLEADRAKQEAKRQKEMMVQSERRRLESERAENEAKRELIRAQARSTVPEEPQQDGGESITKIRVRTPSGEMLERKFYVDTPLQLLLNYITAEGYLTDEFKVISSWPRRDLTTLEQDSTLKELKLFPQETLILEER
uniref:Uncharacterized protein n=1 Tax=Anopheles atroparvus TaxID=41427 RepID=A0A182IMQ1_ANOAO